MVTERVCLSRLGPTRNTAPIQKPRCEAELGHSQSREILASNFQYSLRMWLFGPRAIGVPCWN